MKGCLMEAHYHAEALCKAMWRSSGVQQEQKLMQVLELKAHTNTTSSPLWFLLPLSIALRLV
jgi:hypothetical protein